MNYNKRIGEEKTTLSIVRNKTVLIFIRFIKNLSFVLIVLHHFELISYKC